MRPALRKLARFLLCTLGLGLFGFGTSYFYNRLTGPDDAKSLMFYMWQATFIGGALLVVGFAAWVLIEVAIADDG